uniref:Uncharacterized protein n=1 Tax=Rhizophora mucronata TaxID=61149 RepID=A0A2P2QEJ3_RHIMU
MLTFLNLQFGNCSFLKKKGMLHNNLSPL